MTETIGKRHDLAEDEYALEQGEYGKSSASEWYCRVPVPGIGTGGLQKHTVVENADGTITVTPSILSYTADKSWHGYLTAGVWREV